MTGAEELTEPDVSAFLAEAADLPEDTFLARAYQRVLQRAPDADGTRYFAEALANGTLNRLGVVRALLHSPEHAQRLRERSGSEPAAPAGRRLNLGCGFDKRPGYLNVDFQAFHDPDLVADIRHLDMLPSDAYDEVVAQDCLEHFPRRDTLPALREWCRLLKPGGVLHLRVPNLVGLLELLTEPGRQSIAEQENLVQCAYGTQAYEGDFHHTAFTETLLRHYLAEAGFRGCRITPRDQWLFDVAAEK